VVFLISADLFTCGIATLIQTLGLGKHIGIRMPLMMGVTAIAIGPMIVIGQTQGLPYIYGAIIVSGLLIFAFAGVFTKFLRFFPAIVTGSIITIVGLNLLPVAINWAAGGAAAADFGSAHHLVLAAAVLALIAIIHRFTTGFLSSIAVLLGLAAGSLVAWTTGRMDLSAVGQHPWFALITPLWFGAPKFSLTAILSMLCVGLVSMVESTGVFYAMGKIADCEVTPADVAAGLRAESLAAMAGGVLNSFPYITFSQNVGLVALTGVKSRYVVAAGGVLLLILGSLPKLAALVASIPPAVLGGAGIALFGMVAVTGLRVLTRVDFERPHNMFIAAVSLGLGVGIPMVPQAFASLPQQAGILFSNGIFMGSLAALTLNWLFNRNER
jgi:xanthine permease